MESITTEVVDDKQRRDARGRRIVGQERKAELLRAYDGSDLSQREFARREGINFHTFVEWLQRRVSVRSRTYGSDLDRMLTNNQPQRPPHSEALLAAASWVVVLSD